MFCTREDSFENWLRKSTSWIIGLGNSIVMYDKNVESKRVSLFLVLLIAGPRETNS